LICDVHTSVGQVSTFENTSMVSVLDILKNNIHTSLVLVLDLLKNIHTVLVLVLDFFENSNQPVNCIGSFWRLS
jgi:hypothetical protein